MARGDREWVVMDTEYASAEEFRQAVTEELAGLENIGHRLGGAFVATPLRRPVQQGELVVYETIGWHFKREFMPAVAEQEPEEPAETPTESEAAEAAA